MKKSIIVLLCLLVCACRSYQRDEQAPLASSTAVQPGQSAFMVGVVIFSPRTLWGGGVARTKVGWINVDPSSGLRARPDMPVADSGGAFASPPVPGETAYYIYPVAPGTYSLGWVESQSSGVFLVSAFQSVKITANTNGADLGHTFSQVARARADTPTFEVGAGEVVYVGDVVLDLREKDRLSLWYKDSTQQAAAFLKAHGIEGFVGRVWHPFDRRAANPSEGSAIRLAKAIFH